MRARAQRAQDQGELIGQATLMSLAFAGVDLAPYGRQLRARAEAKADDANAWMDLSAILQLIGQRELGLAAQAQALALRALYRLPAPLGKTRIRLLALMAPGDFTTNAPLDFLLEDSDVALDLLYVGPGLPLPTTLPQHDVMFVAIGESAATAAQLAALEPRVAAWPKPVINRPAMIVRSARDQAYRLLSGVPGLYMPITVRLGREQLAAGELPADLFGADQTTPVFPLIARPLDSHAGKGLGRVDDAPALAAYLQTTPGEDFFISPFVDYRSADGLYRKYRVVLIAGCAYAVHMAISGHWMVHYLNAGMNDDPDKRAQEACFMGEFDAGFAVRHKTALSGINASLALDYLVIDCAETRDGSLLLFEVDTGAVVHLMDPVDLFPYKPAQMRKVFAAFRELLSSRCQIPA